MPETLPHALPTEKAFSCQYRLAFTPIGVAVLASLALNVVGVFMSIRHPPRQEEALLRAKWHLAGPNQPTFEWVIVGDSSASLGVDPSVLSTEIGGDTLNLATFGSLGLTGDLWAIEEYLAHHDPPQGVIIVHAAEVWGGGRSDAFYQYAAAIPESTVSMLGKLGWIGSTPREMFHFLRYRDWFPLLLLKDQARGLLHWSSGTTLGSREDLALPDNGRMRMGIDRANEAHVDAHAMTYWDSFAGAVPSLKQDREALSRLIQLSNQLDFNIYFANGPIADAVASSIEFEKQIGGVRDGLKQLARDHTKVDYLLQDWVRFPASRMENANHLVGDAVDEYTNKLGEAIRTTEYSMTKDPTTK